MVLHCAPQHVVYMEGQRPLDIARHALSRLLQLRTVCRLAGSRLKSWLGAGRVRPGLTSSTTPGPARKAFAAWTPREVVHFLYRAQAGASAEEGDVAGEDYMALLKAYLREAECRPAAGPDLLRLWP